MAVTQGIIIEGGITIDGIPGGITITIAELYPLNIVTDTGDQLVTQAGDDLVTLPTN